MTRIITGKTIIHKSIRGIPFSFLSIPCSEIHKWPTTEVRVVAQFAFRWCSLNDDRDSSCTALGKNGDCEISFFGLRNEYCPTAPKAPSLFVSSKRKFPAQRVESSTIFSVSLDFFFGTFFCAKTKESTVNTKEEP